MITLNIIPSPFQPGVKKSAPPRVTRPENSQPISRVTKPAGRSSERSIAHKTSRNLNRLNDRMTRFPSLSPPPLEDEGMEDSTTVRNNSYRTRGALSLDQDKLVQFDDQDDGVHDQPAPRYYHRKTPSPKPQETSRPRGNRAVTKETIPMKMAEGKERFQVGAFLDTATPFIWQRLDRFSQLKVQLARAIASSFFNQREEKSAWAQSN